MENGAIFIAEDLGQKEQGNMPRLLTSHVPFLFLLVIRKNRSRCWFRVQCSSLLSCYGLRFTLPSTSDLKYATTLHMLPCFTSCL